jgi:long-chain acyl-CoA synthetase
MSQSREFCTLGDVFAGLTGHGARQVICKPPEQAWDYAQLDRRARRLAHCLINAGVARGESVTLLAGTSPEWFAACLGAIGAGAVVVPLDEQLNDEVLEHVVKDSASRFVFTTLDGAERLRRLGADVTAIPLDADDPRWRAFAADGPVLPELAPDDPAALFYTSGTTGKPKGVPLTHANLAFQLRTIIAANLVKEHDRLLLPLPLHHVYPFVIGLLLPLSLGLAVIIPRALTGPHVVEAIREERVTAVVGVPRLYSALYSGIEAQARAKSRLAGGLFTASAGISTWLRRRLKLRVGRAVLRPLHRQFGASLRILACGGSPLDPMLGYQLEGLGWDLAIGYGLTETSPLLTLDLPGKVRMGSVGLPVPEVELRIDPNALPSDSSSKHGREQGEILARGPNVFAGYRNLPKATQEAFTANGFFRTGDLGYFDADGYLYVTGRKSTLIITAGGENVQPDEIESAYMEQPTIREIGVLQQGERLVGLIVPEADMIKGKDSEAAVRAAVDKGSKRLASYQRISRYAITHEALPRTRLGKIQRHLLPGRYKAALQEQAGAGATGPLAVEDMSDQDQALLENAAARQVWQWLGERYPKLRLTPDSNLQLDLGVDSLAWLDLTMAIGQRFNLELDEQMAARVETVRDLLSELSGRVASERKLDQARPLEHPEQVLTESQRRWLEPQGRWARWGASGLYYFNRALMRGLFRVRAQGLDHLPATDPIVLAPNHVSYLDAYAIAAVLDLARLRRTFWGGWVGVAFNSRLKRAFSRMAHILPIEPQRAALSSLAFGALVLKHGQNLAWFPEGERSPNGELLPFKPGLGMLLDHFDVPVVPVYIHGSFQALPRGRFWPRLTPITVIFGAPFEPNDLARQGEGEQPYDRIVNVLQARVAALALTA